MDGIGLLVSLLGGVCYVSSVVLVFNRVKFEKVEVEIIEVSVDGMVV